MQSKFVSGNNADVSVSLDSGFIKGQCVALLVSYKGTTVTGELIVADGKGNTLLDVDITAAGVYHFHDLNIEDPDRSGLVVTLKAGGSNVVGKLNVIYALNN